jgi:lipopolysaccharide/colanic/teichoic acid biosynthesis glycosyltransferase
MATAAATQQNDGIGERTLSAPAATVLRPEPPARLAGGAARDSVTRAAKLVLDVAVAAMLLVLMIPLFVLVVVLIQIESPGTPLYRARRVGRDGLPLDVLKFRKMHRDAAGPPLTAAADARLTRVGIFMARTRIDELPQLWNVVRGQMSLVGPRPEDPRFVALHSGSYDRILKVRPGITGWSQLAYAAEREILAVPDPVGHYVERILPQKVHLDINYAERTRLGADLRVIAWTAVVMLSKIEVSVHREHGELTRRRPRTGSEVQTPSHPHLVRSPVRSG